MAPHANNHGIFEDDDVALQRLRAICLALPEASEQGGVGNPPSRCARKSLPCVTRWRAGCRSGAGPPGAQGALIHTNPQRFFVPPYVGHHGWVGAWLDGDLDWDHIAELIEESYRMTAPKRLSAQLDQR